MDTARSWDGPDEWEDSVARPTVTVRAATPEDVPDLVAMWQELRTLGGRADRAGPPPSPQAVLARLEESRDNPDVRLVVASIGDGIVGMAMLTHQPFVTMFENPAVHLHALHVRTGSRRRGVGRALVASAAAYAEECGADQIMSDVPPALRETNRFYARLGFAPVLVRRAVGVPALRRKMAAESPGSALNELLARRRTVRTRSRLPQPLSNR